jgi:MoaA/NifB/PqqE/SkfB family radical SAM enzyme
MPVQLETLLEEHRFEECFTILSGLLENGRASHALKLLTIIQQVASDNDEVTSRCLYTMGHVLEKLGRIEDAQRLFLELDWKDPKNRWDWSASCRAQDLFLAKALRVTPPRFPFRVQIEVTNRCNLTCVMCPRQQMKRPPKDIDVDLLAGLMDEVAREGGPGVSLFFLGEPLLHPEIEAIVSIASAAVKRSPIDTHFGIQTNGVLLTPERSRRLLERGLHDIGISVDSATDRSDRHGVGGWYKIVKHNVQALVEAARTLGIPTNKIVVTTLMADTEGPLAQRFRLEWADVGCEVAVKPFTPVVGGAFFDADGQVRSVTADHVDSLSGYCGSGTRLLVLSDGTYAFCCADYDGDLGLGHTDQMSLKEVWHSPRMGEIREKILAGHYAGLGPCGQCRRWKQGVPG